MIMTPRFRLYVEEAALQAGAEVTLDKPQSHYVLKVMRQKSGAMIALFNGKDGEWWGELQPNSGKHASIVLQKQVREQAPMGELWLYFAPIKFGRIDFLVQKATEIGVTRLIPLRTRRTIVDRVKEDRLRANAIEAAEQSERLSVPQIMPFVSLDQAMAEHHEAVPLMMADETGGGPSLAHLCQPLSLPLAVLIGPEGGFDEAEITQLSHYPFIQKCSLGPRVLRADTAALAALTVIQALAGDWDEGRPNFTAK